MIAGQYHISGKANWFRIGEGAPRRWPTRLFWAGSLLSRNYTGSLWRYSCRTDYQLLLKYIPVA